MVSIIIPIYNAEKYLDYCLESVNKQTYTDLQIILIDDGSTDASFEIMKSWQNKDNRILIYQQENAGQGEARNNGLKHASGEFVMFVDADDWIEQNCVSVLLKSINDNNSDIAVGLIVKTMFGCEETAQIIREFDGEYLQGIELRDNLFRITTYPVAKLIKKSLLDIVNVSFPKHFFEDVAIMPVIYAMAEKISFENKIVYYYRNNAGSTVNNIYKINDRIQCIETLIDEFKKRSLYEVYEKQILEYAVERCQINLKCVKRLINRIYNTFVENQNRQMSKIGVKEWKAPKVFVFGSYNLMVIAKRFMKLDASDIIEDYFGGESVISCMSRGDCSLSDTVIEHRNPFRKRCILYDYEKRFAHMNPGRFTDVDFIFVDFLEERFDVGGTGKEEYFTLSDYFKDIENHTDIEYTVINSFSDEWYKLWEMSVERFIDRLSQYVEKKQIVLIKTKLTEKYYDDEEIYEFENLDKIRKININLERCYEIFESRCPEAKVFDFCKLDSYKTNKNFRHGCYPYHLNNEVYGKIAESIKRGL